MATGRPCGQRRTSTPSQLPAMGPAHRSISAGKDMGSGASKVKEGKEELLFVNKKKQKNFICFWSRIVSTPREAEQKSFLVLFFKKEQRKKLD
jgi:hypothetical protein